MVQPYLRNGGSRSRQRDAKHRNNKRREDPAVESYPGFRGESRNAAQVYFARGLQKQGRGTFSKDVVSGVWGFLSHSRRGFQQIRTSGLRRVGLANGRFTV